MKDANSNTEEIPVFHEEDNTPEPDHRPEEPHRTINWSHIAILLGIVAGIVIVVLLLTIHIRSTLNASHATDDEVAETASATPKATEATDFYTGDDEDDSPSPSPSASASASPKPSASADADKDKDDDDDDTDDDVPTDLPVIKTYDSVNVINGVSISAKATSGTLEVVATDQDGNSKVIFNEDGSFDKSDVRTDLDGGTYSITLYGNAKGWSWSYHCY